MAKNNHFEKLDRLLREQDLDVVGNGYKYVYQYAEVFARIENAIVVVSDLSKGSSRIYAGAFAKIFHISDYSLINSIWEKEIFDLMSEQEREEKFIAELRFFHFLRKLPKNRKQEYFLMSKLRLKTSLEVLHRIFYIHDENQENVLYTICIYSPMIFDFPSKSYIVNSVTGMKEELTSAANDEIISKREKQILQLISSGMKSTEIADALHISKNTVSRHRQEILSKLRVKNSIEACRLAGSMGLI
ncbi:MAG: LuxR C-terminal-related transcriptional regulator [Muribaculaceae bacterium]|nr:LuxR C-terminal-related transcriptional regulator [Muribaculaceae bacterium]